MRKVMKRFGAIALVVACNGPAPADDDLVAVRGTAIQHNVTAAGVVDQPRDLEATAGDPGARFAGQAAPDLSVYHFGRGDVQQPAADTPVMFELTGLSAWNPGDSLQIVSPNTGTTLAGPENDFAIYPSTGSTTITGQSINWKTAFAPIIDAGKGDTTLVTQLVHARTYSAIARAGTARGFTIHDGRPATLAATLAPVAQDRALALHWKGSAFAALAAQAGPGAQPGAAAHVAISALPEPLAHTNDFFTTYYNGLPDLVMFGPLPGASDVDRTVSYGNPFASQGRAWTELVTVAYSALVPVPTARGIGAVSAMFIAAIPVASLAQAGTIAPAISPVRAATVNGLALDTPRTAVGASPTIRWDAPALGVATSYAVTVRAVEASEGGVDLKTIATFRTRSTALQLPDAMVAPGTTYVLTITAIAADGADLAARPSIGALPYASADYVTAQITL